MDEADITQERIDALVSADVADVQRRAAQIPKGEPGDCELCGEYFERTVRGACARCRDRHKLP